MDDLKFYGLARFFVQAVAEALMRAICTLTSF
jgi:hypothetical protein